MVKKKNTQLIMMNRTVVDVDTIDPKMSETKSLCNSESQRVFVDHVVRAV